MPSVCHFAPQTAHRIITQVAITGARVLGRAISESWKQAKASSAYQKAQQSSGGGVAGGSSFSNGLTLEEACKILNVKPPKEGKMDMEDVMARFKKLFDVNDPKQGGSFYLQSKILRARERLEGEIRSKAEKVAREEELKEGWKPKVFKDR
ncbi:mitochondrial import inner membrane translocase subunit tim-16 protein [Rutstroemia sp. NJR-2017a BBW]|nr:mitochondrial import inner membrane translocase subunit tim-16 protein [Rutstroemia sp. NJR-2017a BBW]